MSKDKDYTVGYGKPPKHSQFPKGQSGNPRGRKKGSRGLRKDLEAALRAKHTINLHGKAHKDTNQAQAMLTLALKAASGDLRANKLLTDLVLALFGPDDRGSEKARLSPLDQQLLERWLGTQEEEASTNDASSVPDSEAQDPERDAGEDDAEGENGHD